MTFLVDGKNGRGKYDFTKVLDVNYKGGGKLEMKCRMCGGDLKDPTTARRHLLDQCPTANAKNQYGGNKNKKGGSYTLTTIEPNNSFDIIPAHMISTDDLRERVWEMSGEYPAIQPRYELVDIIRKIMSNATVKRSMKQESGRAHV